MLIFHCHNIDSRANINLRCLGVQSMTKAYKSVSTLEGTPYLSTSAKRTGPKKKRISDKNAEFLKGLGLTVKQKN